MSVEELMERRLLVEEYRLWKRNAPYLYDYVASKALEWPSLTVEWHPDRRKIAGTDYYVQSVILGTHTARNEQNYLIVADVRIPDGPTPEAGNGKQDGVKSKLEEMDKIEILQKINHEGEVNRARAMPQNSYLVATKCPSGQVLVFDTSRHMLKPSVAGTCTPQLRLGGHKKEGYGLAWNARAEGQLLSGSEDGLICVWDVLQKKLVDLVEPSDIFSGHQSAVQDVAWHQQQPQVFGSVGDDKMFMLWDLRASERSKPVQSIQAHQQEVNCLAFNPEVESVVITGSSDKTIAIWDIRALSRKLYTLEGHEGDVFQVSFSPKSGGILASGSADRRVMVWDLGRMNKENQQSKPGLPSELMFVHAGHTGKLNDISWNGQEGWFLASVGEDNIVQVWCPGAHITSPEEAVAEEDGKGR